MSLFPRCLRVALGVCLLGLTGCLDDALECVWDEHVKLQPEEEAYDVRVGQPVDIRIKSSVENNPYDDRFTYRFTWDENAIPPGLTARRSGKRTWVLSGIPTQAGSWGISLRVFVPTLEGRREDERLDDLEDGDLFTGNCIDASAEGRYLINVGPAR